MNQTLQLPGEVHRKLAQGAAARAMTIESLLAAISDLLVLPDSATEEDKQCSRRIEKLLDRARDGQLNASDRGELDELIDAYYKSANARADRLISAKERQPRNRLPPVRKSNGAPRPGKRTRK